MYVEVEVYDRLASFPDDMGFVVLKFLIGSHNFRPLFSFVEYPYIMNLFIMSDGIFLVLNV